MRYVRVLALVLVVLFILPAALWAQSTTSLRGTIEDSKGAVVQNATVTLTNPQTDFTRTVKTDAQGYYQFLQVPPATYNVTATAPGFAAVKQSDVALQVSTPATLNLTLQVQGQAVTVEVTGAAPMVNTTDASQGNAFNSQQLLSLPAEARDPVAILSLQPGVTFVGNRVDQTVDSRGGSVSGARSDQTNVTLDGLDNNDQLQGLAFQGAMRATLDSLQEFRVTTSNSNADTGRSSGAQVNLVTKSGTNSFHGSVYEYQRPTFTTANDWFNKQAQLKAGLPNRSGKLLRNTFGTAIGGPIKRDRMFFFAAYEGNRQRESQQVTRIIPSEFLRQGIMRYKDANGNVVTLTPAQFASMDPNCSTPQPGLPNGSCPLGPGANPAVLAVFNQYPLPNTDSVGDGLDFRGFTSAAPHPVKLDTYIVKLDLKLTQNGNHSLFVRGNLQNDHEDTPPQFPGQPANQFNTTNSKGIAAGYTALLRSNLINNFRYAFIRQGLGSAGLTSVNLSDFRGLDDPQGFTRTILTNVPVHNLVDDVSWTKGKHTIQFGTNFRFIYNNRLSDAQNFSSSITNVFWLDNAGIANTGSSLDPAAFGFPAVGGNFGTDYDFAAAAVAGLLTQVNATFNQDKTGAVIPNGALIPRHFHSNEAEWYAQDSWRVTPNLVLTAGLRYSLLQPPYETHGNQAAPNISLHDFFNQRGQQMLQGNVFRPVVSVDTSGQANGRKPYWDWDYKDLAPRFAFAYSPHADSGFLHALFGSSGKSSIRGGYGLYFDHFGEGVVNTFDRQGSFGLSTTIINPAGTQDVDCTARFSSLTTVPTGTFCGQLVSPPPPGAFPVTPPTQFNPGSFAIYWGLDDKLKTPYSHVFDFSITRELSRQFVLEGSYIGRLGRRLLQESDLAMPLDLVDPKSKTDYFAAATQLAVLAEHNTPVSNVAPIAYWENMFPAAAGAASAQLFGCSSVPTGNLGVNVTATQAMYDLFGCFLHNETTALFIADLFCFPACAAVNGGQPFAFFDDQWSSLYAWRSQGNSSYHGFQLTLRHPMTSGLQFDLNYTLSKSIDIGSNAERISEFEGFGFGSQVINSWSPNQLRSVSDFDTTHQINANWVYELPIGRGRHWGSGWGKLADAFLGGWGLSGLARWTSGLPFTVNFGAGWPTNWQLQGSAFRVGNPGQVGTFIDPATGNPFMFKEAITDPNTLTDTSSGSGPFRDPHPGESGQRNNFRGPGYFGIDTGVSKNWKITESQALQFRWEVFNVTNSVRFDAANSASLEALTDVGSFGKYSSTLTTPRRMQFSLRYSF